MLTRSGRKKQTSDASSSLTPSSEPIPGSVLMTGVTSAFARDLPPSAALLHEVDGSQQFRSALHHKFYQDNPYLYSGFRDMPVLSVTRCVQSVFQWHNDTVNIWSHLVAAAVGVWFLVQAQDLMALDGRPWWPDRVGWGLFLASFPCMLLGSSVYHALRAHSCRLFDLTLTLDLSGISLCIGLCNCLVANFSLACFPTVRLFWLTVAAALVPINLLLLPLLVKWRFFTLRTIINVLYAGTSFWIHFHVFLLSGYQFSPLQWRALWSLLITYGMCLIGMVIRTVKCPERYIKYHFDFCGSSHQIFHIFTPAGLVPLNIVYFFAYLNNEFSDACSQ